MRSPFGRSPRIWLAGVATVMLALSVARADEVRLAGGDVLRGTVIEQTDTHVVLEHGALGLLEIPRDQITSLAVDTPPALQNLPKRRLMTIGKVPDRVSTGEEDAAAPSENADKKKAEQASRKEENKWKSHVTLAINGSSGNTDTQSLRLGGRSVRKTPKTRLRLDAAYYLNVDDGDRTDNNFTLGILHNWLIRESRWFIFADSRYDYDEFESWEQRIAAHTGPGYHLIDKPDLDLDGRVGIGPRKEFGSEDDEWKPEGLLGVDLDWEMAKWLSFHVDSFFAPIVNDPDDYRIRTAAHWVLKLADDSDLSLTAGVDHEYQSVVDPGKEKSNLKTFIGVQFGF